MDKMTAEEMKDQAELYQAKARQCRATIVAQTARMSALMQEFIQTNKVPDEFKDDPGFEDSDDELSLPKEEGNLAFCALGPVRKENASSLEAVNKVSF